MEDKKVIDLINERLADLYSPTPPVPVEDESVEAFMQNTVCLLPCGGASERMTNSPDKHKAALQLPDGRSIIELTVSSYIRWGMRKFVFLVGRHADSIHEVVNRIDAMDISITFSEDPKEGVGRGGAVKHAIESGCVAETENMLVHNSDDVLVNYPGNFLFDVCKSHLRAQSFGSVATAVITNGTNFPYSCLYIQSGKVTAIADAPDIPIPTHAGITVFSPPAQETFLEMISYDKKQDFEKVIFPHLAETGQLYAFKLPRDCWYPVNNPKEFSKLLAVLNKVE